MSHDVELTITAPGALYGLVLWIQLWTEPSDDPLDALGDGATRSTFSPVFFPLYWLGVDVDVGDRLAVRCKRTMSDDGIHPDYAVSGALTTRGGASRPFVLDQPHHGPAFRQNATYRQLFPSDEAV
jgi:type I protein arginine methyltransferase